MLSERLAKLISTLGIKKGDFADRIGFSSAYISMILSGTKTNPSQRFYESVCREFQVNGEWLQHGTGDMFSLPDIDTLPLDAELIRKYRLLPLPERKIVDEIVDAMYVKNQKEQ